ncbi:hypothetical protein P7K49_025578 [Saguinus oedipus]|uniref:Uncharacterized protein n=1 Tax=Saguinus oedipus TaxID=9490 RepID=A0ABQ9UHJ2_SAGOE|nr:hypothetical protein P7K49_025578 [Saguinus oedipus]
MDLPPEPIWHEVTTLANKPWNNFVKAGTLITKSFLYSNKAQKFSAVFGISPANSSKKSRPKSSLSTAMLNRVGLTTADDGHLQEASMMI